MSLPKISAPTFEMVLPSSGKKITYRQFTVKEEKILLVAQESKDPVSAINAVKQVVNNCLVDETIESFAMFDLEYILLLLRSKSVNNNIRFAISDPDTEEKIELERIKINDMYTLFLKYPNIDQFTDLIKAGMDDPLITYNIMVACLDKVASEDDVYKFEDFSRDDIEKFMEDLSSDVLRQIQKFFDTMPRLRHEMKYKNKNGEDKTFVLEGMQSFFI
jgi:hypothetical protein